MSLLTQESKDHNQASTESTKPLGPFRIKATINPDGHYDVNEAVNGTVAIPIKDDANNRAAQVVNGECYVVVIPCQSEVVVRRIEPEELATSWLPIDKPATPG